MKLKKLGVVRYLFALLLTLALFALLPALNPNASAAVAIEISIGDTPINITGDSGAGWAWDASEQTLTLSGDITKVNIINTDLVTIVIDGVVAIGGDYSIVAAGPLTIMGNGGGDDSLIIESTYTGISAYGVDALLTIENITLTITSSSSYGIDCISGSVTINNADVTISTSAYYNTTIYANDYVTIDANSIVKLQNENIDDTGNTYVSSFIHRVLINSGTISYWTTTDITGTIIDDVSPLPAFLDVHNYDYEYVGDEYLGDKEHPILIQTPAELQNIDCIRDFQNLLFTNNGSKGEFPIYVKLTATEYDLNGNWEPPYLNGEFGRIYIDGNNAEIVGLKVNVVDDYYDYSAGLFAKIYNVEIQDLTIVNPQVYGGYAGALVGIADASYISGIQVIEADISSFFIAGGIVGYVGDEMDGGSYGATVIKNSGVTGGTVTVFPTEGSSAAGGIAGLLFSGTIYNTYNYANISIGAVTDADMIFAGGIVGYIVHDGVGIKCIFNSYNVGDVTVAAGAAADLIGVGGIAGYLEDNAVNNYSSGTVSGPDGTFGQAFGIVADGEFTIARNYFTGSGVGDAFAVRIASLADLLAALNDGLSVVEDLNIDGGGKVIEPWTITGESSFGLLPNRASMPIHGAGSTDNGDTKSNNNVEFVPGPASYALVSSAGEGGTISPLGTTNVNEGRNQSYAITANEGYKIKYVTVDGASVGAVASYSFTNVRATHTISASFEALAAEETPEPEPTSTPETPIEQPRAVTHTITATAANGGAVTPSGATTVPDGGSQGYAINANAGYRIAVLLVDGVELAIGDHPTAYTYDFTDVRADHTISASFISEPDLFGDDVPYGGNDTAVVNPPKTGDNPSVALFLLMFVSAGAVAVRVRRGNKVED
ncbi:MAG: hypothetical protein LBN30_11095 [Oscillospiraceae bacterium]|jgi:hypothetical protein|nr:hypothetical protein [Oscillospiraceae bacterium]